MKVQITTEFKDKHTGKLHKVGSEEEMTIERINEILKVGNFIQLLPEQETEQTEPEKEDQGTDTPDEGEENGDTPKQTSRRKRTNK